MAAYYFSVMLYESLGEYNVNFFFFLINDVKRRNINRLSLQIATENG